jgi:FixJ family two-component response regulator
MCRKLDMYVNLSCHNNGDESKSNVKPIVFVVDDDVSIRESLELLIDDAGWRAEMFSSAREFLARPRSRSPGCLIIDVNLPDISGLDLQKLVVGERGGVPIIFITGYGDVPTTVQAMKAGAVEFLTKPFSNEVLLAAIQHAVNISKICLAREARIRDIGERYQSLTRREREVMRLVLAGRLNKVVASELGISEITVKAHRGNMMRKMKAESIPDLVNMGALLGLLPARMG